MNLGYTKNPKRKPTRDFYSGPIRLSCNSGGLYCALMALAILYHST